MFKGLMKRIFPHLMSHIEEAEYESLLTIELDSIVEEYDKRSLRGRVLAPEKDVINYRVARRIINRRKEEKR